MATPSSTIRGVAAFVNHVRPRHPPSPALSAYRRNVHASVYDKNADEHVCPALVPDYIVQQKSDYWAPNPHTGVFGPPGEASPAGSAHSAAEKAGGGSESVLEQKAFFRAIENLDKPQHP